MNALTIDTKQIRQLDGLYSFNDLHKASGSDIKNKPANYLRLNQTKDLIKEIINCSDLSNLATKKKTGRTGGTYACRELVYAYAMWISPKFHLHVIRAFDQLALPAKYQPDPDCVEVPIEYLDLLYRQIDQVVNHHQNITQQFQQLQTAFSDSYGDFNSLAALNKLLSMSKLKIGK